MHVRVLGADGAGGAAEELGQEAAVAAHAADRAARRRRRAAPSGARRGRRLVAAPHGAIDRSRSQTTDDGWSISRCRMRSTCRRIELRATWIADRLVACGSSLDFSRRSSSWMAVRRWVLASFGVDGLMGRWLEAGIKGGGAAGVLCSLLHTSQDLAEAALFCPLLLLPWPVKISCNILFTGCLFAVYAFRFYSFTFSDLVGCLSR